MRRFEYFLSVLCFLFPNFEDNVSYFMEDILIEQVWQFFHQTHQLKLFLQGLDELVFLLNLKVSIGHDHLVNRLFSENFIVMGKIV